MTNGMREYYWEHTRRVRLVAEAAERQRQKYYKVTGMVEAVVQERGLRSWLMPLELVGAIPPSVEDAVRKARKVPHLGLLASLFHAGMSWVLRLDKPAQDTTVEAKGVIPSDFMRTDYVIFNEESRLPEDWEVAAVCEGVGARTQIVYEWFLEAGAKLPVPGVQDLDAIPWVGPPVLQLIANRSAPKDVTVIALLDYHSRTVRTLFYGDRKLMQAIREICEGTAATVPFDPESSMAESVNTQTQQGESDVTHEQHQGSEDPIGSGPARRRIRIKR